MAGVYVPQNAEEQYYYDALWNHANPSGESRLPGRAAISFFKKAGVETNVLVQLWGLMFSSINIEEFYVALRFITIMQTGEIPLSQQCLRVGENLGLPRFKGVDIPAYELSAQAPTHQPA